LGKDLALRGLESYPVLIGMDTRESGPAIAAQLAGGLAAEGLTAEFLGVITTPGVAWLARTGSYAAGVMVSASNNPFQDNGIKIFDRTGFKLPDAEEHEIEEEIFRQLILPQAETAEGKFAAAAPLPVSNGSIRRYIEFLLSTMDCSLSGLRLVLDCGNGAASPHAPGLFRDAGAEVIALFDQPDGRNINLGCGAVHPEKLREAVIAHRADAGIAFDGDADRAILVAASGRIIDGDAVLLIVSRALQSAGLLAGGEVVSTVMSNIGLERALRTSGIGMVRTQV
jgi:phosphoglucosamine mutase